MPVSSADRILLDTHPHKIKVYLVVHQPETALACRVNGAPTGDPVTTLTFDTVTGGAWGNVEAGQTLLIGSSAGESDRGIVRVKSATSAVLSIAESSDLAGIVQNNDYLTILRDHRFWVKFPRIVSLTEMYEDYNVAYTDENTAFGPVPMMGPCGFVFLDGASIDIDYDFTDSYPIKAGSISSYATTYQHGDGGSSASGTHTETYSAVTGMRGSETKLTVTDGNGKTASGWRYDFILSRTGANAPISQFFLTSAIKNSWDGAVPVSFVVYGSDAARTSIRDGARVWLIYEAWYGDTQKEMSLEYPDRANILFEGWVAGDTIERHPSHDFVTFSAKPITEMLTEGKAYPATLEEIDGTPSEWYQVSSCTTIKSALYLMKWRSTLLEIVDVHVPSSPTTTTGEDWSSGTFRSQIDQAITADFVILNQHKSGQLWIERPISLMSSSDRSSVDTTMCVEAKHWMPPLEVPEYPMARANYVLLEGVAAQGPDHGYPFFSEAPGIAAKYRGKDGGRKDRLAVASQATINQWSGDYLAMQNAKHPEIPVHLTGFWPVFDVTPQRRTWLGLSSSMNNRGINVSGNNFVVRETETLVDTARGLATTSIVLMEETDGQDGQTVEYDIDPPSFDVPRYDPPKYIPPYVPPGWTEIDEGRRMVATAGGIFVTDNIGATTPVWYGVNYGLSTADDKHAYCIARDPYHWWTSGGNERTLWAVTRSGVWKHSSFPNGLWVQMIDYATVVATVGIPSGGQQGFEWSTINLSIETEGRYTVGLNVHTHSGVAHAVSAVTLVCQDSTILNYKHFFMTNNAFGDWHSGAVGWNIVKYNPQSGAQIIFSSPATAVFNVGFSDRWLYRSLDGGSNWSIVDGPYDFYDMGPYASISIPYNEAGNTVVWSSEDTQRISHGGGAAGTFNDVTGTPFGHVLLGTSGTYQRMWAPQERPDTSNNRYTVNAGSSWTTVPLVPLAFFAPTASWTYWEGDNLRNALVGGAHTAGNPGPNHLYYYNVGDAGWLDKTGNLSTLGSGHVNWIDRDSMGTA